MHNPCSFINKIKILSIMLTQLSWEYSKSNKSEAQTKRTVIPWENIPESRHICEFQLAWEVQLDIHCNPGISLQQKLY